MRLLYATLAALLMLAVFASSAFARSSHSHGTRCSADEGACVGACCVCGFCVLIAILVASSRDNERTRN